MELYTRTLLSGCLFIAPKSRDSGGHHVYHPIPPGWPWMALCPRCSHSASNIGLERSTSKVFRRPTVLVPSDATVKAHRGERTVFDPSIPFEASSPNRTAHHWNSEGFGCDVDLYRSHFSTPNQRPKKVTASIGRFWREVPRTWDKPAGTEDGCGF